MSLGALGICPTDGVTTVDITATSRSTLNPLPAYGGQYTPLLRPGFWTWRTEVISSLGITHYLDAHYGDGYPVLTLGSGGMLYAGVTGGTGSFDCFCLGRGCNASMKLLVSFWRGGAIPPTGHQVRLMGQWVRYFTQS
jgi:hypothetical protein